MALVTLTEAKAYLRVTHALEDTLIGDLLTRAKAIVQAEVGVPLTAQAGRAWVDRAQSERTDYSPETLLLPFPIQVAGLVVNDGDGRTLAATEYDTLELATTGMLYAARGLNFPNGPYSGTATIGMSAHPDYATDIEPRLNSVLVDIVAEWYQRRNPGAASEADPGVSTSYEMSGLPPRIQQQIRALAPWRA